MSNSREFRVFIVDRMDDFVAKRYIPKGKQLVLEVEHDEPYNYRYKNRSYIPHPEHLVDFAQRATDGNFDLIIVGNNEGAGVKRVRALPKVLLPQVLVIWNNEVNMRENRHEYEALGVTRFATR
jgi:hypothetical protein